MLKATLKYNIGSKPKNSNPGKYTATARDMRLIEKRVNILIVYLLEGGEIMEKNTDEFVELLAEILRRVNTLEQEVEKIKDIKSFAKKLDRELGIINTLSSRSQGL